MLAEKSYIDGTIKDGIENALEFLGDVSSLIEDPYYLSRFNEVLNILDELRNA